MIVDIAAIAQRLNVKTKTVHMWRYRNLLPAPAYDLAVGPVWDWSTIETWAEHTGRL